MNQTCTACSSDFEIRDEDLAFYERVSPSYGGVKLSIPPPTHCPQCRLMRRITYRNQIYVYSRKSSTDGKPIFSMYPADAPFPVVSVDEWWGDSWDGVTYGRDFDFGRSFFEQFQELRDCVPHRCLSVAFCENSDYSNNAGYLKNCYLVFNTGYAEDSMYLENCSRSKDCMDCTKVYDSELCYDCVFCSNCYELQSSRFCENCTDSFFLMNCRSCQNCYGCVNLRRAQYCIFNEQHSKEDYEAFLQSLDLSSFAVREEQRQQAEALFVQHPRPHTFSRMAEKVSGNYIYNAREVRDSFFIREAENVSYCLDLEQNVKDSQDFSIFGYNCELLYECVICGLNEFRVCFCYDCWEGNSDLFYSAMCVGCEHCFGCVGLNKKRYCIFNKQYSAKEYEELVPRIVEHMQNTHEWGEFFPLGSSPVAYNQCVAQRFFPLDQEQAESLGFDWHQDAHSAPQGLVEAQDLSDGLPASDEPLTTRCTASGRPFRITSEEIRRLKTFKAPLPRKTYDERMMERFSLLGGLELHERFCEKTGNRLLTPVPPDAPWIIWDRDVYEQEFD